MAIHPLIERDRDYIISLRRHFHSHPELSMKEYATAQRIEQELHSVGIPTRRVGETGVLGMLQGRQGPGRRIVLRADIDALPIQDEKTVPYASQCPGVMHACGHDAHTAALLGAARALKRLEDHFSGEVRLVFQPAEEYGAGSIFFIQDGALEGADRSFGIHMQSNLPVGQVAMNPGAENASVDHFTIRIQGKSAHVSTPELGADALYAAAQIVTALQGLVGRLKNPTDPALIGVGVLRSGESYNIVAREAVIEGTVRCFSEDTRAMLNEKIAGAVRSIAALYNTSAGMESESFARALINDAGVYEEAAPVIEQVVGKGNLVPKALSLGGDDMSEILAAVPGVYAYVGSGSAGVPGSRLAHHTPGFDIDERCLSIAASLYLELALFWLKREPGAAEPASPPASGCFA